MGEVLTRGVLNGDEEQRLDALYSRSRRFFSFAMSAAVVSVAVSFSQNSEISALGVMLGKKSVIAGSFFGAIACSFVARALFREAQRFSALDKRRPPFAWFVLFVGRRFGHLWLLLPVLVTGVCAEAHFGGPYGGLTLGGLALVVLPSYVQDRWRLVSQKRDERGGMATFSIWLLYIYRIMRQLTLTAFWLLPISQMLPGWRPAIEQGVYGAFVLAMGLFVVRAICCFPLVYRTIDRIGTRIGFVPVSQHY